MAHRNSINKPKIKLLSNAHAKSLGRKRSARASRAISTRSSNTLRYADPKSVAPRPTELYEVALFTGDAQTAAGSIITRTLLNKRAKKLARNLKYIAARLDGPQSSGEAMDVDAEAQRLSQLEQAKAALWSVLENKDAFKVASSGEGTTMGVQAF